MVRCGATHSSAQRDNMADPPPPKYSTPPEKFANQGVRADAYAKAFVHITKPLMEENARLKKENARLKDETRNIKVWLRDWLHRFFPNASRVNFEDLLAL